MKWKRKLEMSFLSKIKVWFNTLFFGFADADSIIQGQTVSSLPNTTINISQKKETQRVSEALLKGEITQSVKDLRYRDYLVAEGSRSFAVNGDTAQLINNENLMLSALSIPNRFSGVNHEICNGIIDAEDDTKYTLKIEYLDSVKFLLEKYCNHFYVDRNNCNITLYFRLTPNKNILTSKAFCRHIEEVVFRKNGLSHEYSKLESLTFTSYKITTVPNYIKFIFKDLLLSEVSIDNDEIILNYRYNYLTYENLLEKYNSEELKQKYEVKAQKNLPQELIVFNVENKCEVCNKVISYDEGKMNKGVVGKFCCGECLVNELLNMANTLNNK